MLTCVEGRAKITSGIYPGGYFSPFLTIENMVEYPKNWIWGGTVLKVLHFSDLHLGASFRRFAGKGKLLRDGLKKTLINIVNTAQEEKVDLVISSGDIGDSNKLSPGAIEFVVSQLDKLNIPVVILPGNHDCLDKSSIYLRQAWSKLKNVYIFTGEKGQTFDFSTLSLAVHGKANTSNRSEKSPIAGLTPSPDHKWNIAVAHGSLQIEGKSAGDDYPITFEELENSNMNYVALGHWHNFYRFDGENTVACYPGSAGTLSFSHGDSGTVSLIELTDGGVNIERVPVAHHIWKTVECGFSELETKLKEHAHPQCLLNIKLTGEQEPDNIKKIDNYMVEYEDSFFHLDIDYKESSDKELEIDLTEYPETTFVGQFIRLARDKVNSAPDEEKALLEEALKEGYRIAVTGEVN